MDFRELLLKAGVPEERVKEAQMSLEYGISLEAASETQRLFAPFVVLYLVLFVLKWEDDRLPEKYSDYDLEPLEHIDINGDKKYWEFDPVQQRDVPFPVTLKKSPLPRDQWDLLLCYWAKNSHPRSRWARWVWMGWRNRAQRVSYIMGPPVVHTQTESWKYVAEDGSEIIEVFHNTGIWQLRRNKKVLKYFELRQNVGFKVSNMSKDFLRAIPGHILRYSCTGTTFSLKRWEN